MKWLIISDVDITSLKNSILEKDKDSEFILCEEDDITSLLDATKSIDTVSCIVIYSSNQSTDFLPFYTNLTGFAAGADISVWTNIAELASSNLFPGSLLTIKKDLTDIELDISSNFSDLQKAYIKLESKKALFGKGIPFTSDCFGSYITKGKLDICQLFLNGGMDTNCRDDEGTPMLNLAVRADDYDLSVWLMENGAEINTMSEDRGYTPVMDAVWRGNEKLTKLFIEKGADLNTICKEGQSNLILAVGANRPEICKLLAENGADPDIKDMMGMSAYTYAKLFKKQNLVEILEPFHKN